MNLRDNLGEDETTDLNQDAQHSQALRPLSCFTQALVGICIIVHDVQLKEGRGGGVSNHFSTCLWGLGSDCTSHPQDNFAMCPNPFPSDRPSLSHCGLLVVWYLGSGSLAVDLVL